MFRNTSSRRQGSIPRSGTGASQAAADAAEAAVAAEEAGAQDVVPYSQKPVFSEEHNALQEGPPEHAHAQAVVKELYDRYVRHQERYKGYRTLFIWLGFMALYMAIVYTQRNANASFQVHRTLEDVLVPKEDVMGSKEELYSWIRGVLRDVWVDPPCGDGSCEEPYEYPEYSRFGCRADCGFLNEIQNLTRVRIAIRHDFTHPSVSIPAADLMQQTQWNLCPKTDTEVAFSPKCYFAEDKQFNSLSGFYSEVIDDLPDGTWNLIMRRDIFRKTSGSIMDYDLVLDVSYYYRVYVAAVTAMAEQNTELLMLRNALELMGPPPEELGNRRRSLLDAHTGEEYNSTFYPWAKQEIREGEQFGGGFADSVRSEYYLQSFLNATCGCWDVDVHPDEPDKNFKFGEPNPNTNTSTALPLLLLPFALGYNPIQTREELNQRICLPETNVSTFDAELFEAVGGPWELQPDDTWEISGNPDLLNREPVPDNGNRTRVCQAMHDLGMRLRANHIGVVRRRLVDERLGNQRDTGKIEARNKLRNSLRSSIESEKRELFEPIFINPSGSFLFGRQEPEDGEEVGTPHMVNARLSVLQSQFVRGTFNVSAPASLNLTRNAVYSAMPPPTIRELYYRTEARIEEVILQQEQLLNVTILPEHPERYPTDLRVFELIEGFAKALDLDYDGPECTPNRNGQKPCLLLDLRNGRGTVVVANNTVPDADNPALKEIGDSDIVREANEGISGIAVASLPRTARELSVKTMDLNEGVESLNLQYDFHDAKAASVPGAGNGIHTPYTLHRWDGGPEAYLRLRLAPNEDYPDEGRGPDYLGTCSNVYGNLTCVSNPLGPNSPAEDYMRPYNCTVDGDFVEGDLSNAEYRLKCEAPCTRIRDCRSLCHCEDDCGQQTGSFCLCSECQSLSFDATDDAEYQSFISGSNLAGQTKDNVVDLEEGVDPAGRRKLLQDSGDTNEDTQELLRQIGSIKQQQSRITSDMSSLTSQVDISNQLASERANDNEVLAVIEEIRTAISNGQSRVEELLNEILGRQTRAQEVAERSSEALQNIKSLADRQVAAQRSLQATVDSQLSAIQSKINNGELEAQQVLHEWKGTRRNRAETNRTNTLATEPVNPLPKRDNVFVLDNGNDLGENPPRERYVGLTNRVIAGMFIHQVRTQDVNCTDSKFFKIQETCSGPRTIASYGIDPVFKRGTDLFNPDFDDRDNEQVARFYNCSTIENPTYNVTFQDQIVNTPPYCAELYSSQQLPYAFHHYPLEAREDGFPVFLDINLSEDQARDWLEYLRDGLYLDSHTKLVTVHIMTYNAPLRVFGFFESNFTFTEGGSIEVEYRLETMRIELYCTPNERARYAFEVILSVWIYCMMLENIWRILYTQYTDGNLLKFFLYGWNWTEFISNGLLTASISMWWDFVVNHQQPFDVSLRHPVYKDLNPEANFLALRDSGEHLEGAWTDFKKMIDLIYVLDHYFLLASINILMLMVRMLKKLDFQPRLGVVTRSLWLAGPDLIHFAFVFFMVFVGYAMLAHLIFGNAIEEFQTFDNSVNTCFEILLGNISVNEQLRELGGLQAIAGAFFFWTYMLLVFMVLLNFLLAIIVDAFSEVKEQTHETVGIHTELYQLAREKMHSISSLVRPNYISDSRVEALLKQWALGDGKNKQKQTSDVSLKLLTVMNEDLDEEDLKAVLLECLKEAPQEPEDGPEDNTFKGRLRRCLPGQRKLKANPKQVEQAAKFIVDRFGIPTLVEEEDEEDAATTAISTSGGMGLRKAVGAMRERALREQLAAQGVTDPVQVQRALELDAMARGGWQRETLERIVRERDEALRRCEQLNAGNNGNTPSSSAAGTNDVVLEAAERDQLAAALDRLGGVQRLLADSQATLIADQQRLAQLVAQVNAERGE